MKDEKYESTHVLTMEMLREGAKLLSEYKPEPCMPRCAECNDHYIDTGKIKGFHAVCDFSLNHAQAYKKYLEPLEQK
jgi:hypothetical protein